MALVLEVGQMVSDFHTTEGIRLTDEEKVHHRHSYLHRQLMHCIPTEEHHQILPRIFVQPTCECVQQ